MATTVSNRSGCSITTDGLQDAATFQRPQKHDRARYRERETEYDRAGKAPAPKGGQRDSKRCGNHDLDDGAGQGNPPHSQQVFE
jgi:hypothetical protein